MNQLRSITPKKNGMSLFGMGANKGVNDISQEQKNNGNEFTPPAVPALENPFSRALANERAEAIEPESETKALVPSVLAAEEPKIDTLIDNAGQQIKLAAAHDSALEVLSLALDKAKSEMDNIKADKLPSVITAASKVVEGIRKERNEAAKVNSNKQVHLHFYTPNQRKMEDYQTIEA